MFIIGSHLSSAKGFAQMGRDALSIDANTFQFFTRNPRGAKAKELDLRDVNMLRMIMAENNFGPVLAHAPYTMNACSADPGLRELAAQMMSDDLARMEHLPGNLYNFHPGSHVGQGVEAGIVQIVDLLNRVIRAEQQTTVLLETMAGKGSEVGQSFEELNAIISRVECQEHLGICLDTCHVSDAGYDIINGLQEVLENFDRIIGLKRLYAIHLNDSMNPSGSRKDRHDGIGKGCIGLEVMTRIINHPQLRKLPFFLETPTDLTGHAEEIRLLRGLYQS